jgi:hypothetical protein
MNEDTKRILRITGITAVAVAVAGTVAALLVRDQISRQRRNLFNPRSLRRMAALQHIARQEASIDDINLLRDYISWEPRRMLRNRARALVARMEDQAREVEAPVGEPVA